jgi:hypothetical protein
MAKLVGSYKFVVSSVDIGRSEKGTDLLKLGLTFTDELINEEFVEMPNPNPVVVWNGSLSTKPGANGKPPIQMTLASIRKAFNWQGKSAADVHTLMFAQGIAVCEDHTQGNFTRVKWLNNLNDKKASKVLTEFAGDVKDEIDKFFAL